MLRIKELRKQQNITQQQLSDYLGITQATLSGWENEKFEIDNNSLMKCADYFNVSLDYLLGRTEEKNANKKDDASSDDLSEYLEELRTRPEMKMLFNITKKATRADVEKAVKVIEAMLQDE